MSAEPPGQRSTWKLLRRVVSGEGWRSAKARALDRMAARRRRRSFREVDVSDLPSTDLPRPVAATLADAHEPVLNVLSTEPRPDFGGVQIQLALRLASELDHRPVALLYPVSGQRDGMRHRLEIDPGRSVDSGGRLAVRFPPGQPLDSVLHRSLTLCRSRILHVEQPLGLSWPAIRSAVDGSERHLVLSVHDFGLFCSRPHLVERPQMVFCGFCRDDARCTACLRHDDDAIAPGHQAARRHEAAELLRSADAVVFPSAYLRDTHGELFGDALPEARHVVPPPSVAHGPPTGGSSRRGGPPRRVAFVGSFRPHKGSRVFLQLLDAFDAGRVHWHVLGGGDAYDLARLRHRQGVTVHGYYRSGSLTERLRDLEVDLALVLSIWPETYCMTIDESLRAAVPVLAFDHGAPGERLRRLGGGLLVDPAEGGAGVETALRELLDGRRKLPTTPDPSALPDAETAADAISRVYRRVLNGRSAERKPQFR